MANSNTNQSAIKPKHGFTKRYNSSAIRIDMTPMVDLGFLLITFFIFTATISQPNTMSLIMPKEDGTITPIAASGALSILIDENDKLYHYEGIAGNSSLNFDAATLQSIRKIIIDKKREVISRYEADAGCEASNVANHFDPEDCRQKKLMVLIKPTAKANFKNIVNVLDEMTINKINHFAIVPPELGDLQLIESFK